MMKLYPIQSSCQFSGHLGMSMDWLWMASDRVGVSHTEHLERTTTIRYAFELDT